MTTLELTHILEAWQSLAHTIERLSEQRERLSDGARLTASYGDTVRNSKGTHNDLSVIVAKAEELRNEIRELEGKRLEIERLLSSLHNMRTMRLFTLDSYYYIRDYYIRANRRKSVTKKHGRAIEELRQVLEHEGAIFKHPNEINGKETHYYKRVLELDKTLQERAKQQETTLTSTRELLQMSRTEQNEPQEIEQSAEKVAEPLEGSANTCKKQDHEQYINECVSRIMAILCA